jgi:hypothetical protein
VPRTAIHSRSISIVGLLGRSDEPRNPHDSGWAFSTGLETEEYMEDANNMAVVSISSLLELDPALEAILDAPIGSMFRRTSSGYVPDV